MEILCIMCKKPTTGFSYSLMKYVHPECEHPQLTVAKLMERLKAFPPDMKVELEGCDCTGECIGAEVFDSEVTQNRIVLLTRRL